MILTVVKVDTLCPPIPAELSDADGVPLPAPESVHFVLFQNGIPKLDEEAQVLEATPERFHVQYSPTSLTFDVEGDWFCEWRLVYPGPREVRVPTNGYDIIRVIPKGSA